MTICPNTQKNSSLDWDPCDTNIKMAFIKEESAEIRIEETFSIKQEDTEEQTGWFHSQSWTLSFDA